MEYITVADLISETALLLDITEPLETRNLSRRIRGICDYAYKYTKKEKNYLDDEELINNLLVEISPDNLSDNIIDFVLMLYKKDNQLTNPNESSKEISSIKDGNTTINYNIPSNSGSYSSSIYDDLRSRLDPYRQIVYSVVEWS